MKRKRYAYAALGLSCSLVLGASAPSRAAEPATAPGTAPGAGASDDVLQDIVVTAQRRAQSLQDVPVSVSAFAGDDLKSRGVTSIDQIGGMIPNVQIHNDKGGGAPTWVIRGVALFDFNANNNPATAIYIDDVYQSSAVMGGGALYDLERVEVLKGPQGGLYGRNTTGGAVQVLSKPAKLGATDGYASVDYGKWNEYRVEGAQSIPVTDTLALRIAAVQEGGDGWQKTLAGNTRWGAPDRTSARLQALLQPSERFTAQLKLFGSRDQSQTTLATSNAAYDANGGFCGAVAGGGNGNASCLNFAQFNNLITGTTGALSSASQSNDGRAVISSPINRLDNHEWGATLTLDYDFDAARLTSISAADYFHYGQVYDYDATNLRLGDQAEQATIRNLSQELRLTSTGDTRFKWLAGAVYAQTGFQEYRTFDMRDNVAVVSASFTPLGVPQQDGVLAVQYRQQTRHASVYGQADYALTDRLNLSASLRYATEETDFRNGKDFFPLAGITLLNNLNSTYRLHDHVSGKVSADYHLTDTVLLYASAARGYKSGGVFGGFPQEPGDVTPYKEEIVWAYETGVKSTWLDHRLQVNLAGFHYDHNNLQALTTLPSVLTPGQFIFRLTNVGKATHDGVELETTLKPLPGLTLQASGAYVDAEVTQSNDVLYSFDNRVLPWQGRRIDYSPRWTGSFSVRYDHAVTADLVGTAQLDFDVRSAQVIGSTLVDSALRNIGGYGLLNGRLTLASDHDGWSVSLWGKNLLNRHYFTDRSNDGLGSYYSVYGRPLSYGLNLTKTW
ncbi:TonB-dependent receptor [Nitrospirillum sp. BR 11828]|uniref:TonB-dependent receptor n=1 Tax=Nitrospirillum sp. BR 11828 TaxID=3104325 RepID=UPI002ACAD23A|nr:TonB-dependent receptor [Nitrospirillum sp. BR 11828]MDZ5645836.1 TonB-dependent receptor [Nitrospirillum sp. BR 11828]